MPIKPNDARWKLAWVDSNKVPEEQKRAVWKKRLETLKEAKKHVSETRTKLETALKALQDAQKAGQEVSKLHWESPEHKIEFAEWEPHPVVSIEGEALNNVLALGTWGNEDLINEIEADLQTLEDSEASLDKFIKKYSDVEALLKNDGLPALRH
jgi:exonuclease VII small subunit